MVRSNLLILGFATLSSLAACTRDGGGSPGGDSQPAASATPGPHAPKGVAAGSYEDWCGEHQVPESLCTRCDPKLEPAFRATGDWCAEHGLPESQCVKCNPKLEVKRPPKPN